MYIKQYNSEVRTRFNPQSSPKPTNCVVNSARYVRSKSGLAPARCTIEARKDVEGSNKMLPVTNEPMREANTFLKIGDGKGRKSKPQEQVKKKNDTSYEDFLQAHVLSAKREALVNRYFNNRSILSTRGLTKENIATLDSLKAKQESLKSIKPQYPKHWSPYVSEYEDKFGYLQRRYPPRTPHLPVVPKSHYQNLPFTLLRNGPRGRGLWSEYQANYNIKF